MKRLQLNPVEYDIELSVGEYDNGDGESDAVATVNFRLGETKGAVALLPAEAARLGKWFTDLGKRLRKRSK